MLEVDEGYSYRKAWDNSGKGGGKGQAWCSMDYRYRRRRMGSDCSNTVLIRGHEIRGGT